MGDHNTLTLDTPYGFLVRFLMASSETTRAPRARPAFIGDGQTGRAEKESLDGKPERQC